MAAHRYALGIDIGGTKIALGVVRFPDLQVVVQRRIPTHSIEDSGDWLGRLLRVAKDIICQATSLNGAPSSVGIGICELVSPSGTVMTSQSVPCLGRVLVERFSEVLPVIIEADVRAAAFAEAWFGAGTERSSFLFVTLGTGISSCLVVDKVPYVGARGATGTFATSPLKAVCDHCLQERDASIEAIASGLGIVRRYNTLRGSHPEVSTGHEVFEAMPQVRMARGVIQQSGAALGQAIGWLVNVLDPEAVLVGGGLGSADGPHWDSLVQAARSQIWFEGHRDIPIVRAAMGPDAGMIGAAAVASHRYLS